MHIKHWFSAPGKSSRSLVIIPLVFRPGDSGPFAKRCRVSGTTVEAQAFRPGNRRLEELRPLGPETFRRSRYYCQIR